METVQTGHAVIKGPKYARARQEAVANLGGVFKGLHAEKAEAKHDRQS